jgi:tryptophanyl-tRNA synthetase
MSKSDTSPASRVLITDSAEEIRKKIMGAVTDSAGPVTYDPVQRPGVSNLFDIMSIFDQAGRTPEMLASSMEGASHKDLKSAAASSVIAGLAGISERYLELIAANGSTYLESAQEEGAAQARSRAANTMNDIRSAIGL